MLRKGSKMYKNSLREGLMEGRGEMAHRGAKLKILASLMIEECGILELSRISGTARATVSALVGELTDSTLLEREGERVIHINKRIVLAFAEIYRDHAEIVSYYFKDRRCDRVYLRFSFAMTFDGNIDRTISTMERHVRDLKNSGYSVYSALMLVNCRPRNEILSSTPDAISRKSDMTAAYLRITECTDSLLYADENDGSADMYFDGKHICSGAARIDDIEASIDGFFTFARPRVMMLECKKNKTCEDFEKLKRICEQRSVELIFIDRDKLTPSELALALEIFAKHI